jgi:glycosyltransferase involved in cell wall biosynthesis
MISFFGIIHQAGGCGPELLGAIELLRSKSVPVRCIVPAGDPIVNSERADFLRNMGVAVVSYRPGMFQECKILMTFGEDKCFDYMRQFSDRPKWMIWSSCMGHVVDCEVDAMKDGLIDEFFFQTRSNGDLIGPQLVKAGGKGTKICHRKGYQMYINPKSLYMPLVSQKKSKKQFTILKASRDDSEKWHEESWRMFSSIKAPSGVKVQIEVAGWGDNALYKIGNPCDPSSKWNGELNVTLHDHISDPIHMAELYGKSHCLIHYYPFTESFGISTAQAMLSGCVPIGADAQGFRDQIEHGKTGFLCNSADEASYYASYLAFNPNVREEISKAARTFVLDEGVGNPEKAWPWWNFILKEKAGYEAKARV